MTHLDSKRWIDGNLKMMSFTSDLALMRIGFQIFSANSRGDYRLIDGLDITSKHPNTCFEDITSRGSLLVVASRRKMPAITEHRGREAIEPDQPPAKVPASSGAPASDSDLGGDLGTAKRSHCSRETSKSNHASETSRAKGEDANGEDDHESDSSCPTDDTSEWNSAEESWSEASTEVDELGNPLISSDESNSNSSEEDADSDDESETPEDDSASDTAVNSYAQINEESDSDGGDVDFEFESDNESDNELYDGENESDWSDDNSHQEDFHFDSDDEENLARQMAYSREDRKRGAKVEQGVLTIYDLSVRPPAQIFTFTHPLPIMLYDSPPAIHPTKPLVVWSLCGGDVLFADFEGKSYFIRRARTTTRKSRSPITPSPIIL